ncbi:radical SAM protein [Bradyrhizobium sp. DOA9]|uniref:radical SAM protein n=1 Tax=Bradyrhizobium sp. DOA9 TaxID=1126627 RepID=UPI00046894D9|nr:radical SAM protein [Bradyrhizobium sp. DOA9]GAJ34770.1 coenzyme PQQ synthesis protein E [Bradyrhizobium sp. DOA9]
MIVVWRVVDSCNLACGFCAYDKRLGFPRSQAAPADVLRFAAVLAEHQAETGDRVLLSWLGGEPLRWQQLQALTHAVRGLGLEVSATTNGTTLGSPALRQHLCETYKELTISVDGFAAFHDPSRGWAGGFEKLRRWVPQLKTEAHALGSKLKLRANVVLMRQNVRDFAALCEELTDWGIVEITYNQLGGRDRPEFYPQHRLTRADVDALEQALPAIRKNLAARGAMLVGGEQYLARIRASTLGERMPVANCDPGESFLFIDEKGQVSPCSFTTEDYGIDIGSLRSAADLAALPGRFRLLQQAARSRQCDDCLSTQVCGKFNAANRRPTPVLAAAE